MAAFKPGGTVRLGLSMSRTCGLRRAISLTMSLERSVDLPSATRISMSSEGKSFPRMLLRHRPIYRSSFRIGIITQTAIVFSVIVFDLLEQTRPVGMYLQVPELGLSTNSGESREEHY